eukprot:INCI10127.1.p1 GENE.INCI10127.1~~INCI10127.1.p1  ORF type:complete len:684 (-),score=144.12 INCI10127.1:833-2884(-)
MVRVQYDDAAFYIFAVSVLSVYAFPATYIAVGKILRATVLAKPPTQRRLLEGEKEKSQYLRAKVAREVWSNCFIAQLVVLAIVWLLLFVLISSYSAGGDIKQFEPFEILGLTPDASSNDIRRAFRKLSLKYHPDKNPDDPEAADQFMLISKAHEALTDEEAKKNYELYGSPDGKQQMQVSIGLPSFFMDKGSHMPVLIVYLVILVVMIPVGVGTYYASTNKLGENGIMKLTFDRILTLFKPEDAWNSKLVPEILGAAEEFAELTYGPADVKQLEKLHRRWEKAGEAGRRVVEKIKKFSEADAQKLINAGHAAEGATVRRCFYNNVALTAYLMRTDKLTDRNTENARTVLADSPRLVEALIKSAFMASLKRKTSNSWVVVNELIAFQQRLYQCLWDTGDRNKLMFLQFPHITEEQAAHAAPKGRKALQEINEGFRDTGRLQSFIRQPHSERKGLKELTDAQRQDVADVAAIMPNWDVDVEVFVEGEDIISEGAFVTLRMEVTRNEVLEGSTAAEIFAPRFPVGKYESMWMLMSMPIPVAVAKKKGVTPRLRNIKKVHSRDRVVEGILQFQAPMQAGAYTMQVAVKSDSYVGCDFQGEVEFTVQPKDSPELTVFERFAEDEELLREMHGEVVGAESEDSDTDSDDDDAPESKTSDSKKKADSDDEGDDEEDDSDSESESESSDEE